MAITNIPRSFQFFDSINATPNDFNLDAGAYGLTLHATTWGTAVLQKLLPATAGAQYVAVSNVFAADGYQELHLPAGQYRITLAGVTALVGELALLARGGS